MSAKLLRFLAAIGIFIAVIILIGTGLSQPVEAQQSVPSSSAGAPFVEPENDQAAGSFEANAETGVVDVAVYTMTANPNPALRTDSIHQVTVFQNIGSKQASNIDGALLVDGGSAWRWQCSGCWWNPNKPPTSSSAFFQSQGLQPGEVFTITVDVYPSSLYPVQFAAGAWPGQEDANPADNSMTLIVPIRSSTDPDISVYPTLFSFDLASGEIASGTFSITNTGAIALFWRAESENWLSTSQVTGTVEPGQNQPVIMTVNTAGLAGGQHVGIIRIYSNDPDTQYVGVQVNLTVRAPRIFVYDADNRVPMNLQPGEVVTQLMEILNLGDAPGWWQIEMTATAWLSITPTAGTIDPLSSDSVELTFDATGLEDGVYVNVFEVRSNDPKYPTTFVTALLVVGETDIELVIVEQPQPVNAGEQIVLRFAVHNRGSLLAFEPRMTFRLSEPILETVGETFSFPLFDLQPGQWQYWRLIAWVRTETPGGEYKAEVELTSGVADPDLSNNTRPWRIMVKPLRVFLALIRKDPVLTATPTLIPPPIVTPGPSPTPSPTIDRPPVTSSPTPTP